MATNPDRASYFPAIEKRYGLPMSHWFEQMETVKDLKYPEQMAFLRENFGFSQAHANALVQYSRGSLSSRRFDSLDDYLAPLDEVKRETVSRIFEVLMGAFPEGEVVIAWNQPMLRLDGDYIFGASVHDQHVLIAPFYAEVIAEFAPRLTGYKLNKKTIRVPVDWDVDEKLLIDMVSSCRGRRATAGRGD